MEIFSTKIFVTTFHYSYLLQSNIVSVFLPIWAFSQSFLIFWRVWRVLLNLLSMRIRYLKLATRFYAYESYFYGSVLGPHKHFTFFNLHTFFCKIYTFFCKFYTFFCKIYTFFCKFYTFLNDYYFRGLLLSCQHKIIYWVCYIEYIYNYANMEK